MKTSNTVTKRTIKNNIYTINIKSMQVQGNREYQEDCFFIKHIPNHIVLAGVFDGHGGGSCSKWANMNFQKKMVTGMEALHKTKYKCMLNSMLADKTKIIPRNVTKLVNMLRNAYETVELNDIIMSSDSEYDKLKRINDFLYEYLLKTTLGKISATWDDMSIPKINAGQKTFKAGSTVAVVLVVGFTVHIMWLGDSRTIFIRDEEDKINSTRDHKPDERDVPADSNAFVVNNRVNGILGVGRALGDNGKKLRGALKRTPEYVSYAFNRSTTIVVGSDGLYDQNSHNDILHMPLESIKTDDYSDNTTVVRIDFHRT